MDVQGKIVVVTGASSGIGAAAARLLAARGARLVLAARRADRLEALAAELPEAVAVGTDVTDAAQLDRMVEAAQEAFGGVDVLVNNAGQGLHVPLMQVEAADLRAILELNVVAPLLAMQAVVPLMRARGGGAIVNISSGTTRPGRVPQGAGAYAASKNALNMLSQVARAELADEGITVSTIYPFITATEFHRVLRAGSGPAGGPGARRPGIEPHRPELVAEAILAILESGAEEIVLSPSFS